MLELDLVEPVKELMPYRKITGALLVGLVCSVGYGLLHGVMGDLNIEVLSFGGISVALSGILSGIGVGLDAVAIWLGYLEIKYVLGVRSELRVQAETSGRFGGEGESG